MRLHANCVSRAGQAVLLVGPPGSGKSDLTLRLLDRGFDLVADDQVEITDLTATAPESLAGFLEIRGLGILRRPFVAQATLRLVVRMGHGERLPMPARYEILDLPVFSVDPFAASAPLLVGLALDAVQGNVSFVTGAFG
jgi:HPr kinase/phosphorylase